MLAANVPGRIALPFANGAEAQYKNSIPIASQIGVLPGAASYTDGFPPVCFLPLVAGGIAPAGADFNGLLNAITAVQQWQSAGGLFHYDAAFSTAIGGYPAGAMIISTSNTTTWLNLADNNTTNPDATDGSAANWVPVDAYGIAPVSGLTNASVTLLPAQWSKPVIILTGTLTANINIIFPTTAQEWLVVNNTTGAFVVTCKTAGGTGAPVAQAGGQQTFWGDGTNLNPLAGNASQPIFVGAGAQAGHAAQLSQLTGVVGTSRNLKATIAAASASVTFTADQIIVASALNGLQYLLSSFNKTLNTAGTGLNGMDTGLAPISGYVAIYAIFNPTTGVFGLLGVDVTTVVAPEVYGGANLPAGYTASALLMAWPTNGSRQFVVGNLDSRVLTTLNVTSLAGGTATSFTPVSCITIIPKNAKRIWGWGQAAGGPAIVELDIAPLASGVGKVVVSGSNVQTAVAPFTIPILTPQVYYYAGANSAGAPNINMVITAYEI